MLLLSIIGIFLIVIAMLLVVSSMEKASAGVLVVDQSGNGNFTTIQDAVNASEDGDTVQVHDGTYHEHVLVTKHIELVAATYGRPTIDGDGTGSPLQIRSTEYGTSGSTTVRGFEFQGSGDDWNTDYDSAVLLNDAVNVTIESCHMYGNEEYGIFVRQCTNITIQDNILTLNERGITILEHDSITSSKVVIANNTIRQSGVGLSISGEYHVVRNNTILGGGTGISIGCRESLIQDNIVGGGSAGIYVDGDGNIVRWNTIYNTSRNGLTLRGSENQIIGNTISNDTMGLSVYQQQGSINTIKDNLILNGGFHISQWMTNFTLIMENNTMDNGRIKFLQRTHGTAEDPIIIENVATTVFLFECSNITIRNNTISGNQNGIWLYECDRIIISGNEIMDHSWSGIFALAKDCIITDNDIHDNFYGVEIRTSSHVSTGSISISENRIWRNDEYGVLGIGASRRVDATRNWWGDDSGPGGEGPGRGDDVSDMVDFDPWLAEDGNEIQGEKEKDARPLLPVIIILLGVVGIGGLAFLREDLRFLMLWIGVVPLYSRLRKEDILENENGMFCTTTSFPIQEQTSRRSSVRWNTGTEHSSTIWIPSSGVV